MTNLDNTLFMLLAVMAAAIVYLAAVNRSQRKLLASRPEQREKPEEHGEVVALRERVQVLERITVEKENALAREIDSLRER